MRFKDIKRSDVAECLSAIVYALKEQEFSDIGYIGQYNQERGYLITARSPNKETDFLIRVDVLNKK